MELCIYHGIMVRVEGSEGEHIYQRCWCPERHSWHRGDRQNNWLWVKQLQGRWFGALNGRLPWQLQRPFKIKLLNEDGAFVGYWSALALTTIPENSGNLDPISKFVQVRKAPLAVGLQVCSWGNIVGCAHIIVETATSSNSGDGRNKQWIVNRHLDLGTWNEAYNQSREKWILPAGARKAGKDFCSVTHCLAIAYNWYRENSILCARRRNPRRDLHSVTHRIAIPMQACTQLTDSDVWSELAKTPEWSLKIGDQQNVKNCWNSDQRVIRNVTHWVDARRGVIRHRGVSDGSNGARPLWRSPFGGKAKYYADGWTCLYWWHAWPYLTNHLRCLVAINECWLEAAYCLE